MNVWAVQISVNVSDYATAQSWENGTAYATVNINSDVAATGLTNGNNSKYYSTNNSWRHYEGDNGTITISTTNGTLNSVTFTYASGNNGVLKYSNSNVTSGSACSAVNGLTSATFSVAHSSGTKNGNVQITAITVTYTPSSGGDPEPETVSTPSFSPAAGTYITAQNVAISCGTSDATIYYTMTIDGSNPADPTADDNLYSTAISVTKSGTKIKAKAFKNGMTASAVASATYTIKPSKPTITAAGATVTITAGDGCEIYYTTDNSEPTASSSHYTGSLNLNTSCSIKARAYDAYNNASEVSQYNFVYWPLEPKNINSKHFVKVTDVSTLENGDAILIVCESGNAAMSTTQNTNNRGQESVTITNYTIDSPSSDVQKLVLMKIGNYFYFYAGTGYLYAASSNSNYLKTETTPDDKNNAKASITISEGNATITFQGDNTRNVLKHNGTSSLFSCYSSSSDQDAIQIYKEIPVEPSDPVVSGSSITLTTSANMAGWRTYNNNTSNKYAVDGTTKVYYVSGTADSKVTLTEISGGVPANTIVILHQTNGSNTMTLTKDDDATAVTPGSNELQVTTTTTDLSAGVYRLGYKSGEGKGIGFYKYANASAPAGIIYLTSINAAHEFLGLDFDGETTGVNEVTNTNLTNNTNDFYNLAGQRVGKPTKGLYIVNGRKVIIK